MRDRWSARAVGASTGPPLIGDGEVIVAGDTATTWALQRVRR